jgi:ankyrin repeat protein
MVALLIAAIVIVQSMAASFNPRPSVARYLAVPLAPSHAALQKEGAEPHAVEAGRHVSLANIQDWSRANITLYRNGGAFIHTPQYTLEIHGNGTVLFDGEYLVAFVGKHRGTLPQQNVDELVELLKQSELYSLPYGHVQHHEGPTATISVVVNGPGKQSLAFTAMSLHHLPTGEQLEDAIDRLAGSERWIKGNAETLAALQAEHWDLKSHEAANALARLADFGNPEVALELVHAGVPLDGNVRHDGNEDACCPPLEFAAGHGNLKLIQALLDADAVANAEIMSRALFDSVYGGHLDALHLLLANGAGIMAHDLGGRTLLMAAAFSGSPAMLKEILKSDRNVNAITEIPFVPCTPKDLLSLGSAACSSQPATDGVTALMEAVSPGDYENPREGLDRMEVVRMLLAAGANVNAHDTKGNTPLLLCHRNIKLAELLLQAGADPNARNDYGETPLHFAGSDEMQRLLIEHGAIPRLQETQE